MASTILSTPTTLEAGIIRTVVATMTVTSTVTAQPAPQLYVDTTWGVLSDVSLAIFLTSALVAFLLGFSRMVAVPFIASLCGVLNNAFGWYAFHSQYSLKAKRVAVAFADITWGGQDAVLLLYSFFLLEKILKGVPRTVFLSIYAPCWAAIVVLHIVITYFHTRLLTAIGTKEEEHVNDVLSNISSAYFLFIACTETISAVFLLRVFYSARKRSEGMPMMAGHSNKSIFSQLAHSSEIRVATLASIGVTRAVCYHSGASNLKSQIDDFVYTMENCFSIVLLVDLLVAKMMKMQAAIESKSYGDSKSIVTPAASAGSRLTGSNLLGSATGKGAVDSLSADYAMYNVGKDREAGTPAVRTVPVLVEE